MPVSSLLRIACTKPPALTPHPARHPSAQAYHSAYNQESDVRLVGSMSLLPIRTKIRGPAPPPVDPSQMDIVDESIDLFRANSLFRNFEIKGPADRVRHLPPPPIGPSDSPC